MRNSARTIVNVNNVTIEGVKVSVNVTATPDSLFVAVTFGTRIGGRSATEHRTIARPSKGTLRDAGMLAAHEIVRDVAARAAEPVYLVAVEGLPGFAEGSNGIPNSAAYTGGTSRGVRSVFAFRGDDRVAQGDQFALDLGRFDVGAHHVDGRYPAGTFARATMLTPVLSDLFGDRDEAFLSRFDVTDTALAYALRYEAATV